MLRHAVAGLLALFIMATAALAADKEVKARLLKVDIKNKTLIVQTEEGRKDYTVNDDTKYIGPKGGVSDAGIKDDRLVPGAAITLVIAENNRTVREVHLPVRKKGKK
jgi:hypothetical protein